MTTTLDLSDELLHKISLRAKLNGRELQDEVADLLWTALTVAPPRHSVVPITMEISQVTGLQVVRCPPDAAARQMTTAELIALEKEALECEDIERFGLPH
jgi:hypothetical protein